MVARQYIVELANTDLFTGLNGMTIETGGLAVDAAGVTLTSKQNVAGTAVSVIARRSLSLLLIRPVSYTVFKPV